MRQDFPFDEIAAITKYDPWFLGEIETILAVEAEVRAHGLPDDADGMRRLKSMGFSDARLAKLAGKKENEIRAARQALGVRARTLRAARKLLTCGRLGRASP